MLDLDDFIQSRPLTSLSVESRYLLSCLLNPQKVLLSNGLPRDWRGLAALVGVNNIDQTEHYDKTAKVLEGWMQKLDGTATVGKLMEYLQYLDRFDIYDDLLETAANNRLVVIETEETTKEGREVTTVQQSEKIKSKELITFQDKKYGEPQKYHAYVLFAREDQNFVNELLLRLTSKGYKLCTEDDLLPGHTTQYVPVSKLLMERCHKVIVIYSENFFKKPANRFFIDYAQAVSIEFKGDDERQPKLIPCVYRSCVLPDNVTFYHNLYYTLNEARPTYDFWQRLEDTVKLSTLPGEKSLNTGISKYSNLTDYASLEEYINTNLKPPIKNKSKTEVITSQVAKNLIIPSFRNKKSNTDIFSFPKSPMKSSSMNLLDQMKVEEENDSQTVSLNDSNEGSKSIRKKISKMLKLFTPPKKTKQKVINPNIANGNITAN